VAFPDSSIFAGSPDEDGLIISELSDGLTDSSFLAGSLAELGA
jgi:hypothetical protein